MTKKFKLDLHTHPIEALKAEMGIKGIHEITEKVAEVIVKTVKAAGLNGIAITETNNFNHGWVAGLQILDFFEKEHIAIFPGVELAYHGQHFLQLYVPEYYRRRIPFFKKQDWFLILAHPGFYNPWEPVQMEGIKLDAVESQSLHGSFSAAKEIGRQNNIPQIQTSDAHSLDQIGYGCTEVEFGG